MPEPRKLLIAAAVLIALGFICDMIAAVAVIIANN
jgi:hypothetical protein